MHLNPPSAFGFTCLTSTLFTSAVYAMTKMTKFLFICLEQIHRSRLIVYYERCPSGERPLAEWPKDRQLRFVKYKRFRNLALEVFISQ
jgi:hypothetical protein